MNVFYVVYFLYCVFFSNNNIFLLIIFSIYSIIVELLVIKFHNYVETTLVVLNLTLELPTVFTPFFVRCLVKLKFEKLNY